MLGLGAEFVEGGADGPLLDGRRAQPVEEGPEEEAAATEPARLPLVPPGRAVLPDEVLPPAPAMVPETSVIPVMKVVMQAVVMPPAPAAPVASVTPAVTGGPSEVMAYDLRHHHGTKSSQNQATDHVDLLL